MQIVPNKNKSCAQKKRKTVPEFPMTNLKRSARIKTINECSEAESQNDELTRKLKNNEKKINKTSKFDSIAIKPEKRSKQTLHY